MDWRIMPKHWRKAAEKQQQESLSACERTRWKQRRTTTIQDKASHRRTRHSKEVDRELFWIVYTLYTHTTTGDPKVLDVPPPINNDSYPILREEVEAAVKSLKKGKSAGVNNIPSEQVQAGGEAMIDMLLIIYIQIWQTGEWPTPWALSLIVTLPKKGNLQLCQNNRATSLISYPSKVMLRISWVDYSHKLRRLSKKNRQASKQERAQLSKFSA